MSNLFNFEQYGIYLAKVYFEDKPNVFKVRPILVLDEVEMKILVLKMTSKIEQTRVKSILVENWVEYGLLAPTSILLEPTVEILPNDIYADKFFGILDAKTVKQVLDGLI